MASTLLALKLGSTTTTIYREGEGMVLREPSMIATIGIKSREVKAVGSEAKRLLGRTSVGLQVVSPISGGVIVDSECASLMLKHFLRKIETRPKLIKQGIRAIVCVPLGINLTERKVLEKVCYDAGINDVILLPAIVCSAVGDDIPIDQNFGRLLVNIGGGATNIAVMANNQIITGLSLNLGGSNITVAVEKLIEEKYNIRPLEGLTEDLKKEIQSLHTDSSLEGEITGVDKETRESRTVIVKSNDIYVIVEHYYGKIMEAVMSVVSNCPPDIVRDIMEDGMHIFGGGAYLSGFEKFVKDRTGLEPKVSENAKTDIFGAAKLINNPNMLRDILLNV